MDKRQKMERERIMLAEAPELVLILELARELDFTALEQTPGRPTTPVRAEVVAPISRSAPMPRTERRRRRNAV